MHLPEILDRYLHRYATAEDVRKIFADYHDALHWLAVFLIGEELAPACIIDACTIAEKQGAMFHDWLAHWALRSTLRSALQMQKGRLIEIGYAYDRSELVSEQRSLLSPKDLEVLVERSDSLRICLDVLSRFVLVMYGIAKESNQTVAEQLGVSESAVERAYCVAFDTLHLSDTSRRTAANWA